MPIADAEPTGITTGPDGALWFAENIGNNIDRLMPDALPVAPSNLSANSSTNQAPILTWSSVPGATSYNVYRNGSKVGSSTSASYTDNTAPEGNDTYYVTAVNSGGESGQSNSVNVLVDRTPPTITYTITPAPNSSGWNNSPATVSFTCTDNAGGSGITSCSQPRIESADGTYALTGTAVDNAGNTNSVTAPVNIDQTAPTLGTPSWSANPIMVNTGNATLSVPASDSGSGVSSSEYFIGTEIENKRVLFFLADEPCERVFQQTIHTLKGPARDERSLIVTCLSLQEVKFVL